jgi:hypothetical protein
VSTNSAHHELFNFAGDVSLARDEGCEALVPPAGTTWACGLTRARHWRPGRGLVLQPSFSQNAAT